MAAIVNAIVEDIAAVFIIALAIVTIAAITWGPLQVIENMPLRGKKNRSKENNTTHKRYRNISRLLF